MGIIARETGLAGELRRGGGPSGGRLSSKPFRRGTIGVIALLFTALAIVPRSAEAQGGSADERAAKELFKQGLELQARNETAKACEKFNESYRLFPSGVGPMMNAAWCDENAGRTATAWRLYRRAAEAAKAAGRAKDAASADQKANALQPRLPYVTLRVPGTPRAKSPSYS